MLVLCLFFFKKGVRTFDQHLNNLLGRAGRDGKPAVAKMFFNGSDIATNKEGMTDEMRNYCLNNENCLRLCLLEHFDGKQKLSNYHTKHHCCSVCAKHCLCEDCLLTEAAKGVTFMDTSEDKPIRVVEELQRKSLHDVLTKYRFHLLESNSHLATGFIKQTIDSIVKSCEHLVTLSDLKERVNFWSDEIALAVFRLINANFEG